MRKLAALVWAMLGCVVIGQVAAGTGVADAVRGVNVWRANWYTVFPQEIVAHPHVDGLSYWIGWKDIEPVEGMYVWSALAAVFDQAVSHGKKVALTIQAGAHTPACVYEAGAKSFTFVGAQAYDKSTFCKETIIAPGCRRGRRVAPES